jgi:integrase/recombinase XerD
MGQTTTYTTKLLLKLHLKPKEQMTFSSQDNSFDVLISEWLDHCRANDRAEKTLVDYQNKLEKFVWWFTTFYPDKPSQPSAVSANEARAFATYLRKADSNRWGIKQQPNSNGKHHTTEKLSNASIDSYGRTVKTFFGWLMNEGYLSSSPFRKIDFVSNKNKQNRIIKTVSEDNLKAIFDYLTEPERLKTYDGCRNLAMVALLLDTGVRAGELMALDLEELDLNTRRFPAKGKTGERWAFFSGTAKEALSYYLNRYRLPQGHKIKPLWLTSSGKPFTRYGFNVMITRLSDRCGVEFHAHRMRHTYATTLASSGVPVFLLKGLMGHASVSTTEIYVQADSTQLQASQEKNSPLDALEIKALKRHGSKSKNKP